MQATDHAHSPLAAPAHYTPPLWAIEATNNAPVTAGPISPRIKIRPGSEPADGASIAQGRIQIIASCRADSFCRCRRCKPPLSESRDMRSTKRAAAAVAGLFFLCIALQLFRAWIEGRI